MRRPRYKIVFDCFGELPLVLAVHVFAGLDAPGFLVRVSSLTLGTEVAPRRSQR